MEATIKQGNKPQHAPEFLKERKFLMMIPVLIFPFLTMGFWALGGGKNSNHLNDQRYAKKGLNTSLPQAQLKNDSDENKMDVYQTALKDSGASAGNVSKKFISAMGFADKSSSNGTAENNSAVPANTTVTDPNEAKIQAKLAQINTQLSQPSPPLQTSGYESQVSSNAEVKRLQKMMAAMNSGSSEDPEMKQLSRMLEQINDIQNPGNADLVARAKSLKNRNRVYAVTAANDDSDDNYSDDRTVRYASNKTAKRENAAGNAIQAVIHEDQTLVSGAVVKLRLVDGIYVKGKSIPKGSFVYGTCALNNERLDIKISSIRYLNNILPVALTVYDLDGLEGLYVPGSISRDAAKTGMGNAVSSMQLMTMDQSIGAQAAGAGIEAAKGLFGKKVKQIKVKVKAGYEVLLKDDNDRDN